MYSNYEGLLFTHNTARFIEISVFEKNGCIDLWTKLSEKRQSNLLWCDPAELCGEIWTDAGSLGSVDFAGSRPFSEGLVEPAEWLWNEHLFKIVSDLFFVFKDNLPLGCVDFATQWRLLPQSPCPSLLSREGEESTHPWDKEKLVIMSTFLILFSGKDHNKPLKICKILSRTIFNFKAKLPF